MALTASRTWDDFCCLSNEICSQGDHTCNLRQHSCMGLTGSRICLVPGRLLVPVWSTGSAQGKAAARLCIIVPVLLYRA